DKATTQLLFVFRWDEKCLRVPAICASVVFRAVGEEFVAPIRSLPLKVEPDAALFVPLGCRATLRLVQPEKADEVLWWVAGRWEKGEELEFFVDDRVAGLPSYPEALVLRVFARKGETWGTTNVAVSVVPRLQLSFVDPETNEKILAAWPKEKAFKLRITEAFGFPETISVVVGKLGPHPRERPVTLSQTGQGVYESDPLDPQDWQAKTGEFLWAQVCYPKPVECVISVLLPLR
ncbi:MAG: hypothetical protein ACK42E_04125, partial [Candidatus Bipolaricaulaceae bacterium]